ASGSVDRPAQSYRSRPAPQCPRETPLPNPVLASRFSFRFSRATKPAPQSSSLRKKEPQTIGHRVPNDLLRRIEISVHRFPPYHSKSAGYHQDLHAVRRYSLSTGVCHRTPPCPRQATQVTVKEAQAVGKLSRLDRSSTNDENPVQICLCYSRRVAVRSGIRLG